MTKISPFVFQQFFDNNGDPLAGGKIYTYEAGTSTDKDTFQDVDGSAANTNPIILDAYGRANIWLGDGAYKFVMKDSNDSLIDTVDDISGEVSSLFGQDFYAVVSNTVVNAGYQNSVIVAQAPLELSLIPAATAGLGFYFSIYNESGGDVVINPDGSETINGSATLTVSAGGSFLIISNGVGWYTLFGSNVYAGSPNTWTAANTFSSTVTFGARVAYPDAGELTLSASGSISISGASHTVDTYLDAATDNLDTIISSIDATRFTLRVASASRVVTVRHGADNIWCPNGANIVLDSTNKVLDIYHDVELNKFIVLAASDVNPQVIQSTYSTAQSTSSTSYVDVSSFTAAITPNIKSTGVMVSYNVCAYQEGQDGATSKIRIMRDIDAGGFSDITGDLYLTSDRTNDSMPLLTSYRFLDTGATIGAVVTYKLQVKTSSASSTLTVHYDNTKSLLTLEEIFG